MLRAKSLQTYVQVVRAGCSFQTSPPPAIAANLALKTGQEVHRCGHVVAQVINRFSAETIFIRQILTYIDDPCAERIKIFIMAEHP